MGEGYITLDNLVVYNKAYKFGIMSWKIYSRMDWKTLERFDSRKSEIILNAWVFPFYETYKDPVKWVDKFVADFKTLPGVEMVELQKEPLNRNLSQQLIIDVTKETVDALPFTVKITTVSLRARPVTAIVLFLVTSRLRGLRN